MPIKPEHKHLYPENWSEIVERLRVERAANECEDCGAPHQEWIWLLRDGRWTQASGPRELFRLWYDSHGNPIDEPDVPGAQMKLVKIILSGCHLNHDPSDCRDENVSIKCQRCHLNHDRPEHARRRRIGNFQARACGDLFEGLYGSHSAA